MTNFFVAADYVQTKTDLACMEAANEAARAGVNCLLDAAGSTKARCETKPLREPDVFERFQALDEDDYRRDPTSEPFLCRYVHYLLTDLDVVTQSLRPQALPPVLPQALQHETAAPGSIPWWVWTLVLLGVIDVVLLLIILSMLGGS